MRLRPILFSTALLLAGCSSSSGGDGSSAPTALVSLATATSGSVASTQTVYGSVPRSADTQYTLSAPAEGVVSSIAASIGSPVRHGDLIVALKPSPATSATIASLTANARSAQQAYERAKRLRDDGLNSDADLEAAQAAAKSAAADLAAAKAQFGDLSLRSPGAGFVQAIPVNPGELVGSGTTVAVISRTGGLRARFGIDPLELAQLSRSDGVKLEPARDGPATVVPIVSVDPSADPQTRLASIYVEVPSSFGTGAGQPLKGSVTLKHADQAVTVPYSALLDDGGQPYVFVVSNDVAHRKDVTVGATNDKTAAILKGVAAGEKVVTQGGTALEDGMKVRTK